MTVGQRTHPPGPNSSALLPAHPHTPRCPCVCPGLLSASVYRSSKTIGGTEQMTHITTVPILGLSEGQAPNCGTGEEVAQTLRLDGKGERPGGGSLEALGAGSARDQPSHGRVWAGHRTCHCLVVPGSGQPRGYGQSSSSLTRQSSPLSPPGPSASVPRGHRGHLVRLSTLHHQSWNLTCVQMRKRRWGVGLTEPGLGPPLSSRSHLVLFLSPQALGISDL